MDALKQQLATVMADLSGMTPAMAGSEWHQDRVGEARWLVQRIERAGQRDARDARLEAMWRAATFG